MPRSKREVRGLPRIEIRLPAHFDPRPVQEILNEWAANANAVGEVAIWDKVLSPEEISFYIDGKQYDPTHGPSSGSLKYWWNFLSHSDSILPGRWVHLVAVTPTETISAWVKKECK